MKYFKNNVLILFGLLLTIACNSTKIVNTWREPNKNITIKDLNKVLVIAMFKSETSNRIAEDQMTAHLNGKGVVSYNYLHAAFNRKNEEVIRQKIKADGFDGAITMRLIDVDKEKLYIPGIINTYPMYYQNFESYYFKSWSSYNSPGYYTTTKIYTIEVNIFSIKEDKIIWAGITKTTSLDGIQKLTNEVVHAVYKKMLKEGFIKD